MRVHRLAAALVALPLITQAQWTEYALPNSGGGGIIMDHLDDGRFVIGDSGSFIVQNTFGAGSYSSHAGSAGGSFPSFLQIKSDNTAIVGPGNFPTGDLFTFNPGNLSDTATSGIGASVQDYSGALRDDSSLYLAGGNGSGGNNAVSHIQLSDGASTLLIDAVSSFSAGIATDSSGNLYVGNNDDGVVRKFTPTQLNTSLTGSPMTFADGEFVHDFGEGGNIGSLAVDGQGRIWSAGFLQVGLQVYDPNLDQSTMIVPGMANANYSVATFSKDGSDYVSYVNASAFFSSGATVNYGITNAAAIMVPEPSSLLMLALGATLLFRWRKRTLPVS